MVVQLELVVGERVAQLDLMGAACARRDPHRILEKAVGVAALGLGFVEREIGVLEELVHLGAMLRRHRDADAGADIELMTVEIVGRSHRLEQPAGDGNRRLALIVVRRRQNGEFVAAKPRHGVGFANALR
jgi:hypothetical protein